MSVSNVKAVLLSLSHTCVRPAFLQFAELCYSSYLNDAKPESVHPAPVTQGDKASLSGTFMFLTTWELTALYGPVL